MSAFLIINRRFGIKTFLTKTFARSLCRKSDVSKWPRSGTARARACMGMATPYFSSVHDNGADRRPA